MDYIVESDKSFYEASVDLEEVILRLGFSLLHVQDLGANSGGKETEFDEDAKVYAIGSQRLTERLLAIDVRVSLALPCRISVFTENGATKIGMLRPLAMLGALSPAAGNDGALREFENKMIQAVDEAR
jgi:uncharacterized protein (DUF302 family)